jgi:hypothetical protein
MNRMAYLVGWLDTRTGRWVDAGIYSECAPSGLLPGPRPIVLLSAVSRFGYDRARAAAIRLAAKTPDLQWTTRMRTFMSQGRLQPGMKLVAHGVRK